MPLVTIINVINSLDSDSERDALSAAMGKALRLMIEKETAERIEAVERERQARIEADNTEKQARIEADNDLWAALRQEIADRKAADDAEKTAREAADDAEKAAREADVAALNKRIDDLTFEDIAGMLPGERVWATGFRKKP